MEIIDLLVTASCVFFPFIAIFIIVFVNVREERRLNRLAERLGVK